MNHKWKIFGRIINRGRNQFISMIEYWSNYKLRCPTDKLDNYVAELSDKLA